MMIGRLCLADSVNLDPEHNLENSLENSLENNLENTIFDFAQIEGELNYKKAQDSLRELVQNLDLTPQEKLGLEEQIQDLTGFLDKLENSVIQIAAFGMVGRGKSSLLNALLGQSVFTTGALHGVTKANQTADWGLVTEKFGNADLSRGGNSQIQVIDTPGIDEVDGETRELLAHEVARRADLILFIIAGDMTQVEYDALSQLREVGKPLLLVFNKIDQYPEVDRLAIYHKIRDERVYQLLTPAEIVMVAASPVIIKAVRRVDGSLSYQRQLGTPQIDELKLKILEILHREGKSLVALNTMLFATDVNEQLVQRKMSIREASANEVIWKGVMTKAMAIALNPITALDIFTGAIIDVTMILSLSRLYGIPMTQAGAVSLLQKIAISMTGISASEVLASLGLSSLKSLFSITVPMTGGMTIAPYVSVAITQAAITGVATYAIGQVTKLYLSNGASWGPDSPKSVVSDILATLDEKSILHRIKAELKAKLSL